MLQPDIQTISVVKPVIMKSLSGFSYCAAAGGFDKKINCFWGLLQLRLEMRHIGTEHSKINANSLDLLHF